jgi:phospholipase C
MGQETGMIHRRDVIKLSAAGTLTAASAAVIAKAMAAPLPQGATGSIKDVEHVVILMQENRAFDHYYGTLRGVRGFDDPTAIILPGGLPAWNQPAKAPAVGTVSPYRLDASATNAESMSSLDHSWKGSHDRWKHYDAWISAKTPKSMGHFTRQDVPFYYALADAFTICDAYHCSIFGPTDPNRLYLFSGTNGVTVGQESIHSIKNLGPVELNYTPDRMKDSAWAGFSWTPYAERLEKAGVSWKVYQEHDNYGCNALAYFSNFRGYGPATPLHDKARSGVDGSDASNVATSTGQHLAAAFRKDIETGQLPAVSWLVAPERVCEHPKGSPALGQNLVAQLISALADNPQVFAKTVLILNYDENDGFFDHMPPPTPATSPAMGASTVTTVGETYSGEPVGLGPRVPMIVVSPWTKGGFVNSQVFDHTSVLRFLETRFGVVEPNISTWRRTVCGDLTSIFDFTGRDAVVAVLPATQALVTRAAANNKLPATVIANDGSRTRQEPGRRLARPLPYALAVTGRTGNGVLALALDNRGTAGAVFELRTEGAGDGPWSFTVGAGQNLSAKVPLPAGPYHFALRGPNGFLRSFKGDAATDVPVVVEQVSQPGNGNLALSLTNHGRTMVVITAKGGRYDHGPVRTYRLKPGQTVKDAWALDSTAQWYDLVIAAKDRGRFERRLSGHLETGRPSLSDPSIGAA